MQDRSVQARPEALKVPVVVVDRSPTLRWGVKAILEASSKFLLVGEATDARCLARPLILRKGLIVIDARLAAENGFQPVRAAKIANPYVSVLLLGDESVEADHADVAQQALLAGADGYITKDASAALLVGAALSVVSGAVIMNRNAGWRVIRDSHVASGLAHAASGANGNHHNDATGHNGHNGFPQTVKVAA